MEERAYYQAYDDRYRQVHAQHLQWASDEPSAIVKQMLQKYGDEAGNILEIGCGEGRDAAALLQSGIALLATDVSPEAIAYCRKKYPPFAENFQVLDCLTATLPQKFTFIYAVAVVHMLVLDEDRDGFYRFLRTHLAENGVALVCTMGDGEEERQSDIANAFTLQTRTHEESGKEVRIAGTSCRMVSFAAWKKEIQRNGLRILEQGLTQVPPDFPQMMYAVVTTDKNGKELPI